MKMLFIGNLNELRNASKFYRALQDLGFDVTGISTHDRSDNALEARPYRLVDGIFYRLGYPIDKANTNRRIIDYIRAGNRPDVVWILKAPVLRPSTLEFIKEKCPDAISILFSLDNYSKKQHTPKTVKANIKLVDVVFIRKRYSNDDYLYRMGAKRIEYMDFGFDKISITPRPENLEFEYDVVFIGSYELDRCRDLVFLANHGINATVFGGRWETAPAWARQSSLQIQYRIIRDQEFLNVLHRSKIALNFLRKANDDVTTTRSFVIPASGRFMLAERSAAHEQYFEEGKEAEFFATQEELLRKTKYYLQHENEREQIARNGLHRCQTSGYDYHSQLQKMLHIMGLS